DRTTNLCHRAGRGAEGRRITDLATRRASENTQGPQAESCDPWERGGATQSTRNATRVCTLRERRVKSQGAGGGTRTHTGLDPGRCECPASASSATPAPPSDSWRPLAALTQLDNARCPWPRVKMRGDLVRVTTSSVQHVRETLRRGRGPPRTHPAVMAL